MSVDSTKAGQQNKMKTVISTTIAFFLLLLVIVLAMNFKNSRDMRNILEESVKSQLISISLAAREMIDTQKFADYNSQADVDADWAAYSATLKQLRLLCNNVGASYIYALKEIDGEYYFIFDTDTEDEEIFISYPLSPVHIEAAAGRNAADIMNVDDEYGSFNTGAVPIWWNNQVIGIISTDIEDTYLAKSQRTARINAIILLLVLLVIMGLMLLAVLRLLRRVNRLQARLEEMAHYDTVTGLPNRQYLLEYLAQISQQAAPAPFALFFIDLDNFKTVNDQAGHDAGDELLRQFGNFLDSHAGAMAFRPAAGRLNLAARIGGDEFILIIAGLETVAEAAQAAENLLTEFHQQCQNRYIEKYQIGLSIGAALFPYHSENYHILIKYADIAMYHAKRGGKDCYRIYSDEMEPKN